jgi:hypothetical protein
MARRRSIPKTIRLSPVEDSLLDTIAERRGLDTSNTLRQLIREEAHRLSITLPASSSGEQSDSQVLSAPSSGGE